MSVIKALCLGIIAAQVASKSSKMSTFSAKYALALDPFAKRQFNNPDYTGTQVKDVASAP